MKKRTFAILLFAALAIGGNAQSLDQTASLGLLVETLGHTENPEVRKALMRGLLKGLEGRRNLSPPDGWPELGAKLMQDANGDVARLSRELGQLFGERAATEKAFAVLRNPEEDLRNRRRVLKPLITQKNPELIAELEKLLNQEDLRLDVIRAYGVVEVKNGPRILLQRYKDFDADAKRAVVETLATRKTYAQALVKALEKGTVPKKDIPAYVARSMKAQAGDAFTKVYGDVREITQDKSKEIARYKELLSRPGFKKASASEGRAVFKEVCFSCHKMYGEGGVIGPDLTGSNRANRDYILLNILDPNFDVPETYRMVMITSKDEQTLAGNVVEEDDQKIVLGMVGETRTIAKADIAKREVSPFSLMPPNLLQPLTPEQVFNLIKYLQTEQQVELPKL